MAALCLSKADKACNRVGCGVLYGQAVRCTPLQPLEDPILGQSGTEYILGDELGAFMRV